MRCKHLSDNIYSYLNNDCSECERLEIEEHLKKCNSCAKEVDKTVKIINALEKGCQPSEQFKSDLLCKIKVLSEEAGHKVVSESKFKNWWKTLSPITSKSFMAIGSIAAVLIITVGMRSFLLKSNSTIYKTTNNISSSSGESPNNVPIPMKSSKAVALAPDMNFLTEIDINISENNESKKLVLTAIHDVAGSVIKDENDLISVEISSDILEYFTARLIKENDATVSDYTDIMSDTVVINIYFNL